MLKIYIKFKILNVWYLKYKILKILKIQTILNILNVRILALRDLQIYVAR